MGGGVIRNGKQKEVAGTAPPPRPRWIDNVCPGFRFSPTDEDAVVHFLGRKVAGEPLPFGLDDVIPTLRLYGPEGDPRSLFENLPAAARHPLVQAPGKLYAFTRWEHGNEGDRPIRSAGPGTWSFNWDEDIVDARGRIVGKMAHFTFTLKPDDGGSGEALSTRWVMDEYRLPDPTNNEGRRRRSDRSDGDRSTSTQEQPSSGRLVLCRIRYTEDCEDDSLQLEEPSDNGDITDDHLHIPSSSTVEVPEPSG